MTPWAAGFAAVRVAPANEWRNRRLAPEVWLLCEIVDFYVCPYGTAQHKIGWINPVPGIVHVGENKRPVANLDGAYHALQGGRLPSFFFGAVSRSDAVAKDPRKDLFSYDLDVPTFVAAVEREVREMETRRHSGSSTVSRERDR